MQTNISRLLRSSLAIISLASFVACNNASESETSTTDSTMNTNMDSIANMGPAHAVATLTGTQADTTLSGSADFMENAGQVTLNLTLDIPKMANKSVAVHIHEMGDCGDMGKGAHGHWNPTNMNHGKWGSSSFHSGDIGNVALDASGKGTMQLTTDLWAISSDSTKGIVGRSIIVHGGTDDYTSQPSGNAGSRIGCGVINKQ
ncbi:MAG: superoxide dismutase family protein [Ferruginibacter sp.]